MADQQIPADTLEMSSPKAALGAAHSKSGTNSKRRLSSVSGHDDGPSKSIMFPENSHWSRLTSPRTSYRSYCSSNKSTRMQDDCGYAADHDAIQHEAVLGQVKLPAGSLVSGKSRYALSLHTSSNGEHVPSDDNPDLTTVSSKHTYNDIEGEHRCTRTPTNDRSAQEDQCFLDRLAKYTVRKFWENRNFLGLMAIFLSFSAVTIMIVLLTTLGVHGNKRCARTTFCVCSVILGLSCGLLTAALKRSLGEVVILMTFLLCLGILLSSQFDAMMGFTRGPGPGHG